MKSDRELAIILWDYMNLHHKLEEADLLFLPGHSDVRFAKRGAELYKKGYAKKILVSGGNSPSTNHLGKSEAQFFLEELVSLGIPRNDIFVEEGSTNTEENIRRSIELLGDYSVKKLIVLQRPFSSRRVYCMVCALWNNVEVFMDTNEMDYQGTIDWFRAEELLIGRLMGNLKRVALYPHLGTSIVQDIPVQVRKSYQELKNRGYEDDFPKDIEAQLRLRGIVTEIY